MKIAYVTKYDAFDRKKYSGTGYFVANSLRNQGIDLNYLGLKGPSSAALDSKILLYRMLGKKHFRRFDKKYLSSYKRQIENFLNSSDCDVVFSPGNHALAMVETEKPVVFWGDATFELLLNDYPGYQNLNRASIDQGHLIQSEGLKKCTLGIYSSNWAARSAIEHYGADSRKIKVVYYGANIDHAYSLKDVEQRIREIDQKKCVLLFIGVDWHRKGGDIALRVARRLHEQKVAVELVVVGCVPPEPVPDYVTVHPFISKQQSSGRELLNQIVLSATFLILPTRADCLPVVIAEANSFGLPALSTKTGGIPEVIRNDQNGMTFSLSSKIDEYCGYISDLMADRERYKQLALNSYHEYESRLNWDSAGKSVKTLLLEYCP